MSLKISITGHRKLENPQEVKEKIAAAIKEILKNKNQTNFDAYSCLAAGSDSVFAEVALIIGGKLKAVLPMPVSEYLNDFDENEAIIFNNLITNDVNPQIINDKIPGNKKERNEAYLKAGEFITNKCDVLIEVWDGEKGSGRGGTSDIVKYAHKISKPVRHIKAFRSDISRLFIQHDKAAVFLKKIYETLWKTSIAFSLTAALSLAISLSFDLEEYEVQLASIEVFCILVAAAVILYLKWGNLNRNRIRIRRVAERLRVLEEFDNSNINIEKLVSFEGLSQEVIAVENKYYAITYPQNNFERSRKNLLHLVEEQIDYHTTIRPEIKSKTFHLLEKLQFPLLIAFFFGVVFHFITVIQGHQQLQFLPHLPHWLGLILSLSIPSVYAAIEGYIYFKEYHKVLIDSEKMKTFFGNIKLKIGSIEKKSNTQFKELNDYAYLIMKNMDDETKEWVFIMETKETPGP